MSNTNNKRQQLIDMAKGTPQPFGIEYDADTGLYYPTINLNPNGGIRIATYANKDRAKAAAALQWLQQL